jgi:aminoglycoside phosphotransferase (APT) family kinase protein
MTPDDSHLKLALLDAVLRAQSMPGTVDIPSLLEGVRTGANELLLREDAAFFAGFIAEGAALAATAGESAPGLSGDRDTDLAAVLTANAAAAARLAAAGTADGDAMVARLVEWEKKLHAYRNLRAKGAGGDDPRAKITAERFAAYLRNHRKEWADPKVISFRMVPGGFSKITVLAEVQDGSGEPEGLALRIEPERRMLDLDGMLVEGEYPLVLHAFRSGLPVAEPLFLEPDPAHLGLKFMVSRRAPGRVLGTYSGAAEPVGEGKLRDAIALIVQLQQVPVEASNPLIQQSYMQRWLGYPTLASGTRAVVEYWRDMGRSCRAPASAILERATAWMLANVPTDDGRAVLNHGDFGFHNLLFDEDRISALLDWENSRLGDPAEELALFVMASAAHASREQIMAWYDEAGGEPIPEYRLRYYDVYHTYKVIISALVSLQRVQDDPRGSLNLAVFGLQYMAPMADKLEEQIAAAEACRR